MVHVVGRGCVVDMQVKKMPGPESTVRMHPGCHSTGIHGYHRHVEGGCWYAPGDSAADPSVRLCCCLPLLSLGGSTGRLH